MEGGIPVAMAPGAYDVLLSLPDDARGLKERPEYAIRLANADVWEPATGLNSLRASVQVEAGPAGARYRGARWFK